MSKITRYDPMIDGVKNFSKMAKFVMSHPQQLFYIEYNAKNTVNVYWHMKKGTYQRSYDVELVKDLIKTSKWIIVEKAHK